MAGNSESDIALYRKIVELGDKNKELVKQSEELPKHYYSMKALYKDKVKEVVQNHSEGAFIVENKEGLITDPQRLFIKTESAPISVPSVPSVPQGTRFVGKPGESQAVPQVPRVIAPTIAPTTIPKAFAHRSVRYAPYS